MKASEIKPNTVIRIGNSVVFIRELQVQTASSRSGNTLYKVRGRDLLSKQKYQGSFKGDDNVEEVSFERRSVQLLYRETDSCTFMDNETYEQHSLDNAGIEEELLYLVDGIEGVFMLLIDERPIGIELPAAVVMEIVDTAPAIKGASAAARTKAATMNTGLVIQVPEYVPNGERVRVNTLTGEFISRA